MRPSREDLRDASIPFCFDTNCIYTSDEARIWLSLLRSKFPSRELIVPAFVVAERVRQLKRRYGDGYSPELVANFLDDKELQLRVRSFDKQLAQGEWLDCVGGFSEVCWKKIERARFADHGIYATARAVKAILVTNDRAILEAVERDGYRPGALTKTELNAKLGEGPSQDATA